MADTKSNASTRINPAEGTPAGGRGGAWTDTERFQLVLRVLATLLPDGKGVEWKNVHMPDRTQKAVQGQWTSIVAQMREINIDGDGNASTPKTKRSRKMATPRKKKNGAAAEDGGNADEGNGTDQDNEETKKTLTPKKRAAAANAVDAPKKRRSPVKKTAPKVEPEAEVETEAAASEREDNDGEQ